MYRGTPQTADSSTSLFNAFASKTLAELPGGPLAAAFGAEARWERLSYDWDPAVLTGDSPVGSALKAISGSRHVLALFTEVNVPIVRTLDAQLAVCRDDYCDFGATTNPKMALRWQPLRKLLLRGSWGTGFRGPPLYSLNEPSKASDVYGPVRDSVRCPVTGGLDDCFGVVPLTTGGNPNLEPETSTQLNAGVVWEPVRGLSFIVHYWNVEQEGIIGAPPLEPFAAFYARYPDRVTRGPVDPAHSELPGPIVAIDGSLVNLATMQTSGIDLALDGRLPAVEAGRFRVTLQGTYVLQFDMQLNGPNYVSLVASAIDGTPVPRWRSNVTLDRSSGAWGATLAYLFSSDYVESMPPPSTETRQVGAVSSWDVQARYAGLAGWQLAFGIRNLLDSDAPFSRTSNFQFGFNPQMSSPLGRVFYRRGSYAFR